MKHWLVLAALVPVGALAQPRAQVGGEVDLYWLPSSNLEFSGGGGSIDFDGDGFGVRGRAPISDTVQLVGEFQSVSFDDGAGDLDQLRAGVQIGFGGPGGLIAEYVSIDAEGSEISGLGLHWRFESALSEGLSLFGQGGFLLLNDDDADDDLSGFEGLIGLAAVLGPNLSGFIDYRLSLLEYDDVPLDVDLSDLRLGIRLDF